MNIEIGKKYLITTDNWFMAPDGEQYRAAFGTVSQIASDNETLGIKTNRGSTNWFVIIGNMIIAGCQIHYCIKTDECSSRPGHRDIIEGSIQTEKQDSRSHIYRADD